MKMKKILLFAVAMLFVTIGQAQNKNKKEAVKVDFYGIDFSDVNVVGAAETEDQFMTAFGGINHLLVSEQDKFDIAKFLKLDVVSLDVEHATSRVSALEDVKFKDTKKIRVPLKEIIETYPTTEGTALLLVAKELNKRTNMGTFTVVIFDGKSKEIISEKEFKGKAKGFGLRNFWAGALYDGLKSVKSK